MGLDELGIVIKQRRTESKRTLREVAGSVNISPTYLSIIEAAYNPKTKQPSRPSAELLVELARALEIEPRRLLQLAGYRTLVESKSTASAETLGGNPDTATATPPPNHEEHATTAGLGTRERAVVGESLIKEAQIALDQGRYSDAIAKARFVIGELEYGDDGAAHTTLAHAYAGEGLWKLAKEHAQNSLRLDPVQVDVWILLSSIYEQIGEPKEAVKAIDRARGLIPLEDKQRLVTLLQRRREIMTAQRTWIEVLHSVDAELDLEPNNFELHAMRATTLERLGHESEALNLLRQLTTLPDATAELWLARARLAWTIEHNEVDARFAFDVAAQLTSPSNPTFQQVKKLLEYRPQVDKRARLTELGFQTRAISDVEFFISPVCNVEGGICVIGSDPAQDPNCYANEMPQHSALVGPFSIARYPLTVMEYACFVQAGGLEPQAWDEQLKRLDHPVVGITWYQANQYAQWLAKLTGQPWRLPTEVEWECAARWDPDNHEARIYPWGAEFDKNRCNTIISAIHTTTPVGTYPDGVSPCGASDMAGNVWEWTSSNFKPYPYTTAQEENPNDPGQRVMRGGSWNFIPQEARCADRDNDSPFFEHSDLGVRLARSRDADSR